MTAIPQANMAITEDGLRISVEAHLLLLRMVATLDDIEARLTALEARVTALEP